MLLEVGIVVMPFSETVVEAALSITSVAEPSHEEESNAELVFPSTCVLSLEAIEFTGCSMLLA